MKRLLFGILLLSALTADGMMNVSHCLLLYYKYNMVNVELSDVLSPSKEQGLANVPSDNELSKAEHIKSGSVKSYFARSDEEQTYINVKNYSLNNISAQDTYLYNIEQPYFWYSGLRLVNSSGVSPPYSI